MPDWINALLGRGGRFSGRAYAAIGVGLLAIKFVMDWAISRVFVHEWTPMIYLRPSTSFGMLAIPEGERLYYWTMLCAAIPFIWIGAKATLIRLKTIGAHPAWTLLFFVPVVNFFMFTILSFTREPQQDSETPKPTIVSPPPPPSKPPNDTEIISLSYATKWLPKSTPGAMLFSAAVPVAPALLFTLLSTNVLKNYGWGLFVGIPFAISFTSGVLCGYLGTGKGAAFFAGMLSLVLWLAGMVVLQIEGAVCLLMAAPLVVIMGGIGALFGMSINALSNPNATLILLLLPSTMLLEHVSKDEAEVFSATTAMEVDAAPEVVWSNVIKFPPLAAPREWLFRTGVAYPTCATIDGNGVGAKRRCEFSTGTFLEPITVWQAPRLLAFDVTQNPPPLREWTPFSQIDPPHLHGFFVSHKGQFRLIATPDGRTRLEGTTWYQHHMFPAAYWAIWSDYVVHRIHARVLSHIKNLAEEEARIRVAQTQQPEIAIGATRAR